MLTSALEHYERQQRLTAAGLLAARRYRWRDARSIAQVIATFQVATARDSLDSVDRMLEEQQIEAPPVARVVPQAFAGTASDGRPLVTMLEQAVSESAVGLMVVTQLQDAGRAAAATSIATRPKVGWVRMISPGACSRCAVLAGKFFRFNKGFLRHPRCACRHIPSTEALYGDPLTDPSVYFDSLAKSEQDRIFTEAGAEAIRLGADMGQVVNLGRSSGMRVAGSMTDRSWAYQQQVGLGLKAPVRTTARMPRATPEEILRRSATREEAIEALTNNGYIFDLTARAQGRAALDATRRVERAERRLSRRAAAREQALRAASAPDIEELRAAVRRNLERRRQRG